MFIAGMILLVVAGISKAVMDISSEGAPFIWRGQSSFWSKSESWVRKWKNGDPKFGEAFPGSSTFFVFATDPWHFSQFTFLNSLIIGICLLSPVLSFWFLLLVASVTPRVVFEIAYRKLKG
jgi:hypothetical protein